MEQVQLTVSVIYTINVVAQCFPINNGFSLKFNPLSTRQEIQPKDFGALFAKISQDIKLNQVKVKEDIFSSQSSQLPDLGSGCTNQIARISFPLKGDENGTPFLEDENILSIPIIGQSFEKYTMLIAAAPPQFNLNSKYDEEPMVIYIMFPGDDATDTSDSVNIPTIYFASQRTGRFGLNKRPVDPILIINNNRTVTSLKSKEIRKFLRFKNKLTASFNGVTTYK